MQFLKTLFWVVLAVLAVLFADANWRMVEVKMWGGLVADVKLPILLLFAFLIGLLPTMLILRARIWALKRRLEAHERNAGMAASPIAPNRVAPTPTDHPVTIDNGEARLATDSKIWPTA
jgi:lipopolysaccharide assembly protein A